MKYKITVEYQCKKTVEVEADSEAEAETLAIEEVEQTITPYGVDIEKVEGE
jgi:hypothetical protein